MSCGGRLRPNTKLISIMWANNETGVIQPVWDIAKIAAEADVYFHTDAIQAAGKVPIDVKEVGCDLLSISGHKIHAPQGIGALYVRKGTLLQPMLYGGRHERSRRAGTENVPGIVGMGKAAELAKQGFEDGSVERIRELRDRIQSTVLQQSRSDWSEQRFSATRTQHDQHLLRLHRRRSAGDRARPEGNCGFDRRCVFFRSDRAFACAGRDGH